MLAELRELEWRTVPETAIRNAYRIVGRYKQAYSPTLRTAAELLQFAPGQHTGIPNAPSPLAAALTSGLVGAGLGYGAGYLGEKLLPEGHEEGRLRRTGLQLGAALGAAPGAAWGLYNLSQGKSLLDSYPFADPLPHNKAAADESVTGMVDAPPINVDAFNRVLWYDPNVANYVPAPIRAAASGVVTGADHLGRNDGWVTPADVGRLAAGMGVGYASGAIVGKTLGVLMGLPPQTQNLLRRTGMYAGIIRSVIPLLFGGSND